MKFAVHRAFVILLEHVRISRKRSPVPTVKVMSGKREILDLSWYFKFLEQKFLLVTILVLISSLINAKLMEMSKWTQNMLKKFKLLLTNVCKFRMHHLQEISSCILTFLYIGPMHKKNIFENPLWKIFPRWKILIFKGRNSHF